MADPITIGLVVGGLVLMAKNKRAAGAAGVPSGPTGSYPVGITITSYWPYDTKTVEEARMEGGHNDRKGRPLFTLQDHLDDPARAPYVSLACDYTFFRTYGQIVEIPALDAYAVKYLAARGKPARKVIARLVDTGGHFYGPGKVYRNPGHEPIDVCVRTRGDNMGPLKTAMRLDPAVNA